MMHHKFLIFITIILLLPLNFIRSQENNILNYENSVKYANHLFENQIYDLSAIEYERIVYLAPSDTLAKLRLIQSFRFMNQLEKAEDKLDTFFPCCTFCCNKALATEKFKILFLRKRYNECEQFIADFKNFDEISITEMRTSLLLMQNKWSEAKKLTETYLSNKKTNLLSEFRDIAVNGESIRYKNPFLAASFSGFIPGSGKFYTGNWKDGLYSLFVVSALSYITYRSFEKNGANPYGFIFGTAAFSFYTANIYGSYKSALRYNKTKNAETVKDVQRLIFEKQ